MRHTRSLDFDPLEARKLLTRAHHAVAHPVPAVVAAPLVLDGNLTVDNKAATTTMNSDGGTTTSTPVAGVLSGMGKVRGIWNQSADSYGGYLGPDTLQLHDPQGKIVVTINDANRGKAQRTVNGAEYAGLTQRLYGGSGAYAGTAESGTVALNTNSARTIVESLTLNTKNK